MKTIEFDKCETLAEAEDQIRDAIMDLGGDYDSEGNFPWEVNGMVDDVFEDDGTWFTPLKAFSPSEFRAIMNTCKW